MGFKTCLSLCWVVLLLLFIVLLVLLRACIHTYNSRCSGFGFGVFISGLVVLLIFVNSEGAGVGI